MLWWQNMGKVVIWVKLAILSQSEPHFGKKMEKHAKSPKLAIWSQSKPLFLAKFTIVGHFEPLWCETI